MPKLIGITGLAGHGKDTLALSLGAALGSFEIITFADPIRATAAALGLCIYDREKKELPATIRFEHFELTLIEALVSRLEEYVGEEDLCELYSQFATILRSQGYVTTGRQDVLEITARRFCQLLGTEAAHPIRRSFWIDVFRARVAKSRAKYVIASDVRFKPEALVCDVVIGVRRPGVFPVESHASEKEIPGLVEGADHIVRNDGTLQELNDAALLLALEVA